MKFFGGEIHPNETRFNYQEIKYNIESAKTEDWLLSNVLIFFSFSVRKYFRTNNSLNIFSGKTMTIKCTLQF